MGIAAFPEDHAASGEELLRLADFRLYRAKEKGRNTIQSTENPLGGIEVSFHRPKIKVPLSQKEERRYY